jgi:hypothetical protein
MSDGVTNHWVSLVHCQCKVLDTVRAHTVADREDEVVGATATRSRRSIEHARGRIEGDSAGQCGSGLSKGGRRKAGRCNLKRTRGTHRERGTTCAGDGRRLIHCEREVLRGVRTHSVTRGEGKAVGAAGA